MIDFPNVGWPRLLPVAAILMVTVGVAAGCTNRESIDWPSTYASLDSTRLGDDAQAVVDCIADAGFPGYTATADGGVLSPALKPGVLVKAEEVQKACAESIGGLLKPRSSKPTDDELRELYYLELEASRCLVRQDYRVSDSPPLQLYIDTFGTDRQWGAWASLGSQLDPADFGSLGASCPDPMWFLADLPAGVSH